VIAGLAWLRLDLPRRWRSLIVLALLVAVASGVVTAATAGARRGGTAMDRLIARTLPATAAVLPNQPGFDWDRVRRLPGVAAVSTFVISGSSLRIEGLPDDGNAAFPLLDDEMFRTLERPVILSGRLFDQRRQDEIVASPRFLAHYHLKIGDTLVGRLPTPAQADGSTDMDEAGPPVGPRQPLRIVGVIRSPWDRDDPGSNGGFQTTLAFTTAYRANIMGTKGQGIVNALVRLRGGEAGLPALRAALARATGRDDIEFMNLGAKARHEKKVTGFESNALLAFALAALLAAIVLLGQAVARYAAVSATDLRVLRTLGMTSRQAVVAAAAGPTLAALVGVAAGAAGAVAASGMFPIGSAAADEPDPGVHADLTVLGGVAGGVLVLMIVAGGVAAWFALSRERSAARPRRSTVATAAYRLGLPVPLVVGARFALEPGRGRTAVPVRPALVGAVAGVLGVLAALTFRAGVADAAANPARFGQTFQLATFCGFNGQDFAPCRKAEQVWTRDADVLAVNDTKVAVAAVGKGPVTFFSYAPVGRRPLSVVTLSGRMPTAADEVALAPESLTNAGLKVGDVITVKGQASARLRVTGSVFVPEDSHSGYADGAWIIGAGFQRLFPRDFKYHESHLELRPGADVTAVAARLTRASAQVPGGQGLGVGPPFSKPTAIVEIRDVRTLPLALGAFLALLAIGATGHALVTAVRRRRHDVAVLRALGMTRRQTRLIVVTQATTLAVVGLVIGVPLGVALGRTVWRAVADNTPLLYVPPLAALALALIVPAALVIGNLLAAAPARRAARLRVGDVLRSE
jgi:FtsX-like permease family